MNPDTAVVAIMAWFISTVAILVISLLVRACRDWWKHQERQRIAREEVALDRQAAALRHQIEVLAAELGGDLDRALHRMSAITDALSNSPKHK